MLGEALVRSLAPTLWLDASDTARMTLVSTTHVSTWTHQMSSSVHADQAVDGLRPLTVAGTYGPAVRFDAVDDILTFTGLSSASGDYTIFFANYPTAAADRVRPFFDDQTGRLFLSSGSGSGGAPALVKIAIYDGAYHGSPTDVTVGHGQLWTYQLTGGAAPLIRLNGVDQGATSPVANYTQRAIGGTVAMGADFIASVWYGGDVHEFIIFNSALSTALIGQIEAYLMAKWFALSRNGWTA